MAFTSRCKQVLGQGLYNNRTHPFACRGAVPGISNEKCTQAELRRDINGLDEPGVGCGIRQFQLFK